MISNKTVAILLFITLNMQCKASTFRGAKRRRSSIKSTITKKQKRPSGAEGTVLTLRDTIDAVQDVEAIRENTKTTSVSLEQPSCQIKSQFKTVIEKGKYWKIFRLGEKMNNGEFFKQLCPVVKTLEQYNGIIGCLKCRNLVDYFYAYGDIKIVKEAIVESGVYDEYNCHVKNGDLENALLLALEKDRHGRFIKLLEIRMGITAKEDEGLKLKGEMTGFEWFLCHFLRNFDPWEDGMALRRFIILCEDEFKNKCRDSFDTLYQKLVVHLRDNLHLPNAKSLLVDLIGQPLLLTSVAFANLFLRTNFGDDKRRSNFIRYGWRETIQEGLKSEYSSGCKKLWRVMQAEQPGQFPGIFPDTEEARAAVCAHIPTKREKENEWIKKNAAMLYAMIHSESILNLLPDVLWSIIFEYAVLLVVTWNLTTFTE